MAAAYREAMERGDRSFSFARLGLAAVLCDLGEYSEASTLAQAATADDPGNPAVVSVVLRCLEECRDTLEQSVDPRYIDQARIEARDRRAHAQTLEPVPALSDCQHCERVLPQYLIASTGAHDGKTERAFRMSADETSRESAPVIDEPVSAPAQTVRDEVFRRIVRALRRSAS